MKKIKKWGLAVLCGAATLVFSAFLFAKPAEVQVQAEEGTQSILEMENGTSLKINSEGGLRFRVKMDETEKNYIVNNDNISLYFLIAPKDLFDNVTYTNGEWDFYNGLTQKLTIPVDENKIYQEGDYYWANGCIVSIKESNRERDFMSIAYTYNHTTGERTYATTRLNETVYDVNDESFSLNYVRGDLYDVLNQSVLYTANNTDYSNSVFNCSAYNQWFGTADYNILIDSIDDYKNLTVKINDNTLVNNFKGKCFTIEDGVLEDPDYVSIQNKPTFHSIKMNNGEEVYHEYLLLNGSTITMPKTPIKEAGEQHTYKFNSWTNVSSNVAYDFSTIVNSDITLNASYEAIVDRDAVILWSASTAETVLQDKAIDNYASAKKAAKINLSAARNESEGAQIFLTADVDIESYDIETSNLVSKGGATFSAENIEVYSYKYIYVTDNVASHRGFGTGWYPDAIMPFATTKEYEENTIQMGQNQGVYIRFDIPADCQDGVYTGSIKVTYDGVVEYVPVTLTVWDITVSETNNLNTLFSIGWNWMGGEGDYSEEQYYEYVKLLNEYRLSPVYLMINNNAQALQDENYWDTYADVVYQYVINPNNASYALNYIEDTSGAIATFNTEEFSKMLIKLAEKSFATNVNVLEKAFIYFSTLLDEATMQGKYNETKKVTEDLNAVRSSVASSIRSKAQIYVESYKVSESFIESIATAIENVPHVFVSNYDSSYDSLINQNGADEWCPNLWEFQEDSKTYTNLGVNWWYGCSGSDASIPSYQLDDYTLSPRLMSWQQMYYGITGNLYWGVDYYGGSYGNYYNQSANINGVNGDGWLVYPGAPYGLAGPVATRRLEAIRDGMEEYEMLLALKNRYAMLSGNNNAFDSMYSFITSELFNGIELEATAETFARARTMAAQLLMLANSDAEVYIRSMKVQQNLFKKQLVGEIFVKSGYSLSCNAGDMTATATTGGTIYSFTWNISNFNEAKFEVPELTKNNKFTIYNNGLTIGAYDSEVLIGQTITIPSNNLADITATFNGKTVDITSGKYVATESGMLLVTYTAAGYETVTIQIDVRAFAHVMSGEEVEYVSSSDVKEATIDPYFIDFGTYAGATFGNVIVFDDTAVHTVQFDTSVMNALKQYNYAVLKLLINDNGWGVSVTANGQTYKMTGNKNGYTLSIKTEGWDGKLSFRAYHYETWTHPNAYKIYVTDIFAGYMEHIVVDEFDSESIIGSTIVIPEASIAFGSSNVAKDIQVSAVFNGEAVDVSFGEFRPLTIGTLLITYSAEGVDSVTIEIQVINDIDLVTKEDLIGKTTLVSGAATIGNVSDAMLAAESSYCIKLPADYSNYSVTVDVEVGDVSKFSYVEIKFWALGIGGDTWTMDIGGTTVSGTGWANDYNNPVILQIPASAVVNGKLRITFTETWAIADELYIQYIKGIINGDIEVETPDYVLLGSKIQASDFTANYVIGEAVVEENLDIVSATLNGAAIQLPYAVTETGILTLTYEYMGIIKSVDIEVVNELMLVEKENLIGKTTLVSGAATIGNVSDAMFGAESSYCIKLPADYANYNVTIDIEVGDVSKFTYLELKFWVLGLQGDTWTVEVGGKSVSGTGWANDYNNPVFVQIPTSAVVDGKLRLTFSETWAIADELYIQHIKGVVEGAIEIEAPEYVLLGSEFKATDVVANYVIGEAVINGNIQVTSATFNGAAIELPFLAMETGTLTLTYEYMGVTKSIDVEVIDELMFVEKENLISKTTLVSGVATIGNVSDAMFSGESSYCIKLPADYANYSVTVDIEVGDVSKFTYLEIKFWALGIEGDTWTVSVGGKSVSGTGWANDYNNPVFIQVPTSAVVDGKLRLTFSETWAIADELYIQHIKGVVEGAIEVEAPEYLVLGSEIQATDFIANYLIGSSIINGNIEIASASINGAAIELPYVAKETGILTLTYEYKGIIKSVDIEIIDEWTFVAKENLISKTTLVSGAATIGNVSDAMFGAESSYCIKLPADYANYNVTIDIEVGDVSKFTYLELKFWVLGLQGDTWTVEVGGKSVSGTGWANDYNNPVFIQVPTSAVVDGKLRLTFSETWAIADELYIQHIKGVVEGAIEIETPDYLVVGGEIQATDFIANYVIGNSIINGNIEIASATFNGEAIELPFLAMETGTLTLTYEYMGVTKSIDVEVIDELMFVEKENLISKTTLVSGAATIGNVSDAMFSGESSYCIKLPADYANYSVTVDIEVGDIGKFNYLEIKFWALGLQGDTWTVEVGGKSVSGTGWANDYNNPVFVQIPTSAVVDGKLRLTFSETWAIADELYIQYIKGVVIEEAAVVPTEDKTLVTKENLIENIEATCPVGGELFQVGNATGLALSSEASYAIKLPSSTEHAGYYGATATIVVNVGDVTGYDHLEFNFWAIGNNSDRWTLTVGGQTITGAGWDNAYYNPAVVMIDVSAVVDGKLTITFAQTNGDSGGELYIQYIKAIAPTQE